MIELSRAVAAHSEFKTVRYALSGDENPVVYDEDFPAEFQDTKACMLDDCISGTGDDAFSDEEYERLFFELGRNFMAKWLNQTKHAGRVLAEYSFERLFWDFWRKAWRNHDLMFVEVVNHVNDVDYTCIKLEWANSNSLSFFWRKSLIGYNVWEWDGEPV